MNDDGDPVISLLDEKGKVRAIAVPEFDMSETYRDNCMFAQLLAEILRLQPTAKLLHRYMKLRARDEGTEHTLTVRQYMDWLLGGTREFRGVRVDPDAAGVPLLEDTQNPEFLQRVKAAAEHPMQTAPSSSAVH